MEEPEVWKAGVYAFTQNGIKFYCAGFDILEAEHFMELGQWWVISPQREVKFFCAQGQESDVKQAFIDHGGVVEKVYQVIDKQIIWPDTETRKEKCDRCGSLKIVGRECDCTFWNRSVPGEVEKEADVPPDKKPFA